MINLLSKGRQPEAERGEGRVEGEGSAGLCQKDNVISQQGRIDKSKSISGTEQQQNKSCLVKSCKSLIVYSRHWPHGTRHNVWSYIRLIHPIIVIVYLLYTSCAYWPINVLLIFYSPCYETVLTA